MLPGPGKSSGNYGWTTFFLQRSFLERRSPLSASPSAGSDAVALLILEQLRAEVASTTLVTLPLCTALKAGQRGAAAAHSSEKKYASQLGGVGYPLDC
jgi:hypothetical protein